MSSFTPQVVQELAVSGVGSIRYVMSNGEPWFTAEAIGEALGYSEPRKHVNNLYNKYAEYLQEHTSVLKLRTEAGVRDVRVFDEVGTTFLIQKSSTPRASEASLAISRTLQRVRRQALTSMNLELHRLRSQVQELPNKMLALSPSERERLPKVVRYRRMGLSFKEIAKLLDCGRDTVRVMAVRARELGLLQEEEGVVKGPRKLDATERAFILEERRKGRTYATIARALGRNKDTVRVFYLRDGSAQGGDHA